MSAIGRIFGERRSLSPLQAWITDIGFGAGQADSGIAATQRNSTALPAVYACTSLIADTISTLPIDSYIEWDNLPKPYRPRPTWLDTPVPNDPSVTFQGHISEVALSLLFDGNAFVFCLPNVYEPEIVMALDPATVTVKQGENGRPVYSLRTAGGFLAAKDYGPENIVHIPRNKRPGQLRGMSPIDEARQSIGTAMAAQKTSGRFFRNGAQMTGALKTAAEMTQDQADQLRDKFTKAHTGDNAWKVGVLTGGADWVPMSVTPDQAQFLDTMKFHTLEVARLFRVPPILIQVNEPGAVSYASADTAVIAFEKHTLRPLIRLIQAGYQRLMPHPKSYLRFNTKGLLQGDPKTQLEMWVLEIANGLSNRDEIRALDEKGPLPNDLGQIYTIPQRTLALDQVERIRPTPPTGESVQPTGKAPEPPMQPMQQPMPPKPGAA